MFEDCDNFFLIQKLWSVKVQQALGPIAPFFYDEDYDCDDEDLLRDYNEAVENLQHAKDEYEQCMREKERRTHVLISRIPQIDQGTVRISH